MINHDEWLKAIEDARGTDDRDALTIAELAEAFQIPERTMFNNVQKLVSQGKAIRTRKRVQTNAGSRLTSAYRLIKEQ